MSAGRRIVTTCLLAALVCGCGRRGPRVELVEGAVVLDGKPVEGATVFFSPVASAGEGAAGLPAAGRTGFDGGFRLNAGGGAKPGAGTAVSDIVKLAAADKFLTDLRARALAPNAEATP